MTTSSLPVELELVSVGRVYPGRAALGDIDLVVREGQTLAIVGPSGSGKSTLLSILGLLDRPTSGQYWVRGRSTEALTERQLTRLRATTFGFVYQAFHLVPYLSAIENVELGLTLSGAPRRGRMEAAERALLRVGLGSYAQARSADMSGGEQQRVAIARALARSPRVLLCDEPTGNLDTANSELVLDSLLPLSGQTNCSTIIVTHNPEIARRCDRVITLVDGQIRRTEVGGPLHAI